LVAFDDEAGVSLQAPLDPFRPKIGTSTLDRSNFSLRNLAAIATMRPQSQEFDECRRCAEAYMHFWDRRRFLQSSAALGGSLLTSGMGRSAEAKALLDDVPVVDQVVIREITDNQHNIFLKPFTAPGLSVARTGFPEAPQGKTLESEWGLALHIESTKGGETKRYLLDYGFTSDVYLNNLELMKIDPATVDAMILSHGHFDHWGGLMGFLEARRSVMRKDLRLYTGGEDDFCHRFLLSAGGTYTEYRTLDRNKLRALNVDPVLSEAAIVIEGHAFTTGVVPRTSIEHVLPNSFAAYGVKDEAGCDASAIHNHHFTAEELSGEPQPDQHWSEHATCFSVGNRGLVVISSCGHAGIVNTLKRAQEVSGIEKIYALVGGFHLAPAPDDYLQAIMAELKKFDLDHVMPMHCSGQNFVDLAAKEMPEKLVLCGTGSSFIFTG
jgi:7,8-dihydropterin-6-yl-methyl-4-(beta-D-ribofuranosyl)aminobenzene 5'-phosphate synthase